MVFVVLNVRLICVISLQLKSFSSLTSKFCTTFFFIDYCCVVILARVVLYTVQYAENLIIMMNCVLVYWKIWSCLAFSNMIVVCLYLGIGFLALLSFFSSASITYVMQV